MHYSILALNIYFSYPIKIYRLGTFLRNKIFNIH